MKQSNLKILKQVGTISCKDCLYNDHRCIGGQENICGHFCPIYEGTYIDTVVSWLRDNTPLSRDNTLSRCSRAFNGGTGVVYDDVVTLDACYVRMINDTLKQIRQGKIAYLYSWEQIVDIMRFEKNISVDYKEGIFYIAKVST